MKKLFRILALLVLLLLVALLSLPIVFQGRIQEEIKKAANDHLTAVLAFEDVSLSLLSNFPKLTVEIDDLSLSGTEKFEGVVLADIAQVRATLDLFSLFDETISINEVTLIDPVIDVRVLEDGTANYDIGKEGVESAETEQVDSGESGGFSMALEAYTISNGSLVYDDLTYPMHLAISGLNHSGSGNFTDLLFTLQTTTTAERFDLVYDGIRYVRDAKVDLSATFEIDNEASKYTFKENVLLLNKLPIEADGFVAMPSDDIEMDISFSSPGAQIIDLLSMVPAEFATDLVGVQASGTMALTGFIKGVMNETTLPGFGIDLQVDNGRFSYPDMPKSVENIRIDARVDASKGIDNDAMLVDVDRFYLEMAGNPVDLALHLRNPYSDPLLDLTVQAKVVFESLAEAIPLEKGDELTGSINANIKMNGRMSAIEEERYNDFKAEGELVLLGVNFTSDSLPYAMNIRTAYFDVSPQQISLSGFDAMVGATDLRADGRFTHYLDYALRDSLLTGVFNVQSKNMDLNEFMSEETSGEADNNLETDTENSGVISLPGNVDFELQARFDRMIFDDLEITKGQGTIVLRDRVAHLTNVLLETLGGTITLNGTYDTRTPDPLVDMSFALRGMDIKKTAEAFYTIDKLAPIAKSCTGAFSTNMNLRCALSQDMTPIEETIGGGGGLQTQRVYIEKFEPLNKIASELGIARLAKQSIENVNLTYHFENGKVIVDPFTVNLEGIPATFEGSMSFSQELDYRANMEVPVDRLPSNMSAQASGLLQEINERLGSNLSVGTKIPVSLRITGSIDSPQVTGNYGETLQEQKEDVKEQIKEAVQEEIEKQIDHAKEEAIAKAKEEASKIIAAAQEQANKLLSDARMVADQAKNKAYEEAQKVEASAKNPLERAAKRLAAEELRKKADKAHADALSAAQKQADAIITDAQLKADEKIAEAEAL